MHAKCLKEKNQREYVYEAWLLNILSWLNIFIYIYINKYTPTHTYIQKLAGNLLKRNTVSKTTVLSYEKIFILDRINRILNWWFLKLLSTPICPGEARYLEVTVLPESNIFQPSPKVVHSLWQLQELQKERFWTVFCFVLFS